MQNLNPVYDPEGSEFIKKQERCATVDANLKRGIEQLTAKQVWAMRAIIAVSEDRQRIICEPDHQAVTDLLNALGVKLP